MDVLFLAKKECRPSCASSSSPTFVFRVFSVVVVVVTAVVSHANDDLQAFFLPTNACACIFAEAKRDGRRRRHWQFLIFVRNLDKWAATKL